MGGKDSKPAIISYEEASKRVSDAELKRLKDAFKRSSVLSGHMTKSIFIQEVLGDGVPQRLAEQMFLAFGGTQKGINFKDLLCGLVLLTRGKQEEKIKFAFGLYANDSLTHVQKEQMDAVVLAMEGQVPQALSELFLESDCVSYEMFRRWLLCHMDVTSITTWLLCEPCTVTLSNDLETPTFHQTLAGVTHLEESDIMELEKRYWVLKSQSSSGHFDLDTFRPIVCPPIPPALCEGLFQAFDENCDNHIDFKEMACGISASCRGPLTERQKFCFKVFDTDHDGLLSKVELTKMVDAMLAIRKENTKARDRLESASVTDIVADILREHDTDGDDCITQEEYLVWTVDHNLPNGFLQLLFQICHIVLGLKPQNKIHEAQVISGWMERDERRGLKTGQVWYLVAMSWWNQWAEYVNYEQQQQQQVDSACNNNKPTVDCFPILNSPGSLCTVNQRWNAAGDNGSYSTLPLHTSTSVAITSTLPPHTTAGSPRRYATLPGRMSPAHSRSSSASPKATKRCNGVDKMAIAGVVAQRPGAVDNTSLIVTSTSRVMTLTNEGGRLKRDKMLALDRDFKLLPELIWKAVSSWYGSSLSLPRTVILPRNSTTPELELYPICVRLMRHQLANQRTNQATTFTDVVGGIGGYMMSTAAGLSGSTQHVTPRKYLAYTAAFSKKHTLRQIFEFLVSRLRISKDDMRLWKIKDEQNMTLLEEEELTVEDMGIEENMQLLIEVRNKDLTWPEEMSQLAKDKANVNRSKQVSTTRGASGLNNLGNTCFMNTALQCVSNTRILTHYFNNGMHLYELNRTNPLGMKGHIAQRYGELVKDLWSGTSKSIAPLKFRWTIGKYTPRFNGFQQHDSQEMLAFLLDGLHEDLNRVHVKPYVELKDSDGRPDQEVAKEAWDNHLLRNGSVVVDLFHGQLKSCVRCKQCGHTSVRFDPFTYLSLPLPMDSCVHVEVVVVYLDGSPPTRYGLRLGMDEKYKGLKTQLGQLCDIPSQQILLVEVFGAVVKAFLDEKQKIKSLLNGNLYAYQLPAMTTTTTSEQTVVDQTDASTTTTCTLPASVPPLKCAQRVDKPNGDIRALTNRPSLSPSRSLQLAVNGAAKVQRKTTAGGGLVNGSAKHDAVDGDRLRRVRGSGDVANSTGNGELGMESRLFGNSNSSDHCVSGNETTNTTINDANLTPARGDFSNPVRNAAQTTTPYSTPVHVATHKSDAYSDSGSADSAASATTTSGVFTGFAIAVHRKTFHMDVYFLSSQKSRPSLFGTPLILPCDKTTTNQDLYRSVWIQVSRLVSPLPPSELNTHNHAQDCDDSLGYEYPFLLKVVKKDGLTCAWCPWYRFCRGCPLEYNDELFNNGCCYIAVDWEPTALHLRYQTSQEKINCEHSSVAESRRKQTEPIDLDACLRAFTTEEELGEDELYYCSKCQEHRLAVKKLDIWRLPPILIIHLKRFQFLNNRWVKSQKIVKFPTEDFDPSNYLVPRSGGADTAFRSDETQTVPSSSSAMESEHSEENPSETTDSLHQEISPDEIKLVEKEQITDADSGSEKYDLYAMSCHTGILGGGHYVCYAKNPNSRWYCYNDSSCKDVSKDQLDTNTAYILFYEKQNLDCLKFMPDTTGQTPDLSEIDDDFESEFKKICSVQ